MLTVFTVLLRVVGLACRGHRAVALENLALRQQLCALKRQVKRPTLRRRDRLFWIVLAKTWRGWRTALFVVQPDTVVRWHRQWCRRRWRHRSEQTRPGRPGTAAAIRALVVKMGAANPLWGAPRRSRSGRSPGSGLCLLHVFPHRAARNPELACHLPARPSLHEHLVSDDMYLIHPEHPPADSGWTSSAKPAVAHRWITF